MEEELNINRKSICDAYPSESHTEFLLARVAPGEKVDVGNHEFNNIVVVLEGRMKAGYNEYADIELARGKMVFMPAYADSRLVAVSQSKVIVGTFELPVDVYGLRVMESLWELQARTRYVFAPVPVKPVLKQYLNLLERYLADGLRCPLMHEVKEKEILMILMWYYSDEEFVSLFHPIISKSPDLRAVVIKNHMKVKNVSELAEIAGMSRSGFDAKFREAFGESPKQWMHERKAASIKYYMTKPGVTVKDIMQVYGFSSFTQFNRFSRKYLGGLPKDLLKGR